VVWKDEAGWKTRRVHLGGQKEAFDTEIYEMSEGMKNTEENMDIKEVRSVTVYTDSQLTPKRIQSDKPGQDRY